MLSKKALRISPSPTMAIDSKAKEMKSRGIDVIGFGAGEPDFDTPLHIREAAVQAIADGHTRYTPAAGTPELKETICEKLKIDNGLHYSSVDIVVSNGAKHSLNNTLAALLNPGDEVIIPTPYWVSYPEMVALNDGIPVGINCTEDNNLKVTVSDLEKATNKNTKAIIINSPSNPTGQIYSEDELKAIADFCCEHNIYIIADEIYEKLIYGDNNHVSIASFSDRLRDLTIVVNGVSKSYAMTGWRIGYTASNSELASVMANIQSHTASNPNSIAQKAAVAALRGEQDCIEIMRRAFEERCSFMYDRIRAMPLLKAIEPQGAFYLFVNVAEAGGMKHKDRIIEDGDSFASSLLESHNVALVPGSGFGAPDYIRLSFATSMENIVEGLNRIETFLAELQ